MYCLHHHQELLQEMASVGSAISWAEIFEAPQFGTQSA